MNTQDLKFVLDLIKDSEAKEFWKQTYSGELTAQDLANELSDMHIMISNVPKIVNAVTGGLLSYATYPAQTVIAKFNDYVDEVVKESIEDYKEENQLQPLSDDEIEQIIANEQIPVRTGKTAKRFARAIEKALKEKNRG